MRGSLIRNCPPLQRSTMTTVFPRSYRPELPKTATIANLQKVQPQREHPLAAVVQYLAQVCLHSFGPLHKLTSSRARTNLQVPSCFPIQQAYTKRMKSSVSADPDQVLTARSTEFTSVNMTGRKSYFGLLGK